MYGEDSWRKGWGKKSKRGGNCKPLSLTKLPSKMMGGFSEFDGNTTQYDTGTEASIYDKRESKYSSNKFKTK